MFARRSRFALRISDTLTRSFARYKFVTYTYLPSRYFVNKSHDVAGKPRDAHYKFRSIRQQHDKLHVTYVTFTYFSM